MNPSHFSRRKYSITGPLSALFVGIFLLNFSALASNSELLDLNTIRGNYTGESRHRNELKCGLKIAERRKNAQTGRWEQRYRVSVGNDVYSRTLANAPEFIQPSESNNDTAVFDVLFPQNTLNLVTARRNTSDLLSFRFFENRGVGGSDNLIVECLNLRKD